MKPFSCEVSSTNSVFLNSLVSCIEKMDCSNFFPAHLGKNQREQKAVVEKFQKNVAQALRDSFQTVTWNEEYRPGECRDAIDIFGEGNGFCVVIELDKNRADQVAKKFVSRMALIPPPKENKGVFRFSVLHC